MDRRRVKSFILRVLVTMWHSLRADAVMLIDQTPFIFCVYFELHRRDVPKDTVHIVDAPLPPAGLPGERPLVWPMPPRGSGGRMVEATAEVVDVPLDDRGAAVVADAPLDDHGASMVNLGDRMAARAVPPPPAANVEMVKMLVCVDILQQTMSSLVGRIASVEVAIGGCMIP
jgi:hypothetical protein